LSRHHFVENRNRTLYLAVRHGFDRVGMLELCLVSGAIDKDTSNRAQASRGAPSQRFFPRA
jgi:hypothetical protein